MRKNHYWTGCLVSIIFLIAIFLRVTVPNVDRQILPGDEATYNFSALSLIHHHTFTRDVTGKMFRGEIALNPTVNLSPGFPIYIAAIYKIFGEDTKNILISNIVLSILSFWLIYRILKILRVSQTGLVIALIITAVYPGFLYNLDRLLTEQLFMMLFLGAIYLFLAGTERQKVWVLAASGITFAAATHVRAQAVPLAILAVVYLAVYTENRRDLTKMTAAFIGGFAVCMAPWWIRNYLLLGEFIPLTHAGEGAKIWGAVPYFLDINDATNRNLSDVIKVNYSASPDVYIRWRLFGYMNNMWADVWDEKITHPGLLLQRIAFVCQMLLVVPAMVAMPQLIKRRIPQWTLIATIPLAVVIPNIIFHGLPRYAFPAVPYVIITIGLFLTRKRDFISLQLANWQAFAHRVGHRLLLCLSIFYAVWIAYSVYIFPDRIAIDMSAYRLGKYAQTSISELRESDIAFDTTYEANQFEISNSKLINDQNQFQNVDAPGIFTLKLGSLNDSMITRVEVKMKGGAPYDYTTLYWSTAKKPEFSEYRVYRAPRFWFKHHQVFYIDGDAKELLLVPSVLLGNQFTLDSVRVTKFRHSRGKAVTAN